MAIAFGTQEYDIVSKEAELLTKNKQINSKEDFNNFLKSKNVLAEDFWLARNEEKIAESKGISDMYDTTFDPGKLVGSVVGNTVDNIGNVIGGGIELAAGKEARENVGNFFEEAGNVVDNVLPRSFTNALKKTFDPKLNTGEDVASKIGEFVVPYAGVIKGYNVLGQALKIPKATTKAQQRIRNYSKWGTAGVAADVLTRDGDEQFTIELIKLAPDLEPYVSALAIDPDDSFAERKLKQVADSTLGEVLLGGLLIGGVKVVNSTDLINRVKKGSSSLVNKVSAVKNNNITQPVANVANSVASNVKVVKNSVGQYMQNGTVQNIVGQLGKVNSYLGRTLTSKAGMEDYLFKANIKRREFSEAREILAQKEAKDLDNIIDKYKDDRDLVNRVLQGEKLAPQTGLSKEAIDQANKMNKMIQDNTPKIKSLLNLKDTDVLSLKLDATNGTYLTRTYQFSSNPEWTNKIGQILEGKIKRGPNQSNNNIELIDIVENARSYILKQHPNVTADQADSILNEMLKKGAAGEQVNLFETLLYKGLGGLGKGGGIKVGKKRKDIDKPILEFLGEIKDPTKNFITTLQSQNKLIGKAQYLQDIKTYAENSLGRDIKIKGLFPFLKEQETEFIKAGKVNIGTLNADQNLGKLQAVKELESLGVTSKRLGLDNLYTTKEMSDILDNGLDVFTVQRSTHWVPTTFAKLAGIGQANQTVLDNGTQLLNIYGAAQQVAMNGHVFNKQIYRNSVDSVKTILEKVRLKDPKALEEIAYLKQAGIIDSNIDAEIALRNLNARGTPNDIIGEKSLTKKVTDVAWKPIKATYKGVAKVYGGVDDVSKLISLKSEVAQYKKAFPNLSEKEILDKSIEIVRNTMPSYSTAAPAVRALARLPFGTYATFPAEVLRSQKNIVSQGIRDVLEGRATNNPELVKIGYKRLVSMSAVTAGIGGGILLYNQLNNISPVEERVVKFLSADYSKNSPKIFTQAFKEDADGTITAKTIDSGAIDASQYIKGPIRAIIGRLVAGEEVTQRELDDVYKEIGTEIISPYISPKFITKDLMSLITGRDDKGREVTKTDAFLNITKTLLLPGVFENVYKAYKAGQSEKLMGKGKGVNEYGFPNNFKDQVLFNWTGIRKQTINLNKQLGYNIYEDLEEIKKSTSEFKNLLNKEIPVKILDQKEKEDIINKYLEIQLNKKEAQARLYDKLKVFQELSYTDKKGVQRKLGLGGVQKLLSNSGMKNLNNTLLNSLGNKNSFIPDKISPKEMYNLIKSKNFPIDVLKSINHYSNKITGSTLRDY